MMSEVLDRLNNTAELALTELTRLGADAASVCVTSSEKLEFNVDGGEFSLLRTTFSGSTSLLAIKGLRKGTASQNKTDADTVRELCRTCIDTANSSPVDEYNAIAESFGERRFGDGVLECDRERLFARTRELLADITRLYPKIIIEQMIVDYVRANSVYRNTGGSFMVEEGGYYSVGLMYSAHEGEVSTSFFSDGFLTDTLDTPFMDMCEVRVNLQRVQDQLNCAPFEGKESMTMLLTPATTLGFMEDVVGKFLGSQAVMSRTSPWMDKLGKAVASSKLTVRSLISDEHILAKDYRLSGGYLASDTTIIDRGVLNTFVLSDYAARKCGYPPPTCSFSSVVIESGDTSLADIISGIKRGILVGRFSGGEVAASGDFSGVAKNSFLIEDGRITHALTETMISGNIEAMFKSIIAVSEESICDGACRVPYMAVDGITVSGK